MTEEFTHISDEQAQVIDLLREKYEKKGMQEYHLRWDDDIPGFEFRFLNGRKTITGHAKVVGRGEFEIVETDNSKEF